MQVTFTYQQYRIVRELATDGADNETIARRLGIGVETVRSHLTAIYKKTGYRDRTELAVAVLHGDILVSLKIQGAAKTKLHLAVPPPDPFRRPSITAA